LYIAKINDYETWEGVKAAALESYSEYITETLEKKVGERGSEISGEKAKNCSG